MEPLNQVQGTIVDTQSRRMFRGTVWFDTHIRSVVEEDCPGDRFILPGLVDAHVHVESSLLPPSEFARLAVRHGTVAVVSDPHEIANVMGVEGIRFLIENARDADVRFLFGAPSCVPATPFETSGASVSALDIEDLFREGLAGYLSEVMNFPGVLHADVELMQKIQIAHKYNVPLDGHAPGLRGSGLAQYVAAGISTDHECFQLDEAREKARLGMHILIREGSASANFEELIPLLAEYPRQVMFCTDDLHPDDLMKGHINRMVARALAKGYDLYDTLDAASRNPALHYGLPPALLRVGDPADFLLAEGLENMKVLQTYRDGRLVWNGCPASQRQIAPLGELPNRFHARELCLEDLRVPNIGKPFRAIGAIDGSLITRSLEFPSPGDVPEIVSQPGKDLVKILVLNRYRPSAPAVGFISGTGIRKGALAASVAHDSHNIVAMGADDQSLVRVVNALVRQRGGIAVCCDDLKVLPLPVAGLMSAWSGEETSAMYSALQSVARGTGCSLSAPFMTLSFMSLLVIPELKLSDRGLFHVGTFSPIPLYV